MEILILVLLYYLSQNPHFAESVKPLMSKIKDSEQMLNFLNDLSKFSGAFGGLNTEKCNATDSEKSAGKGNSATNQTQSGAEYNNTNGWQGGQNSSFSTQENAEQSGDNKKSPQSPTIGIADDFIQSILESYLKKN